MSQRLAPVLITVSACIWTTANVMVGLFGYLVFAKVLQSHTSLGGDLMSAVFDWVFTAAWVPAAVITIFLSWSGVRRLRDRAVWSGAGAFILALLVAALHVGVMSVSTVAHERRQTYNTAKQDKQSKEADLAEMERRFDSAHELSLQIFKAQSTLLCLLAIGGTVLLIRSQDGE